MALGSILGSLGAMVGAQTSGLAGQQGVAAGVGTSVQGIAQAQIPWPVEDIRLNQWKFPDGATVSRSVAPTKSDAIKHYFQYMRGNMGAYTQVAPPPPSYIHTSRPNRLKLDMAFKRLAEGLPFRVASTLEAKFGPEGNTNPAFEIHYSSGHVIRFENIDTFPTEADIARICLEAP